MEEGILS